MERNASSLKMKEIKRLAQEKQYLKAMKILGTMNIDKIRNMSDLSVIAEIFIHNDEYEDAMEILLRIYEKSCTRRIVEQLIDLSIRMKNMEETKEYYKEYLRIAPRDPYRLVLRYKIEKANHMPYSQRIETLEQLKHEDYMEEWAYELAKLYHKTGQVDKCVEECSDIILWFGQGIVVEKARLLKEHYTSGFNITDNLGSREFDATRSLEEVIRQVKSQRGAIKPAITPYVDNIAVESEVDEKESSIEEVQPLYQEEQPVVEKIVVEKPRVEKPTVEEPTVTSLESNYVLTPEVVKAVRERVNTLDSQERELVTRPGSLELYDSHQDIPTEQTQELEEVDTVEEKLLEEALQVEEKPQEEDPQAEGKLQEEDPQIEGKPQEEHTQVEEKTQDEAPQSEQKPLEENSTKELTGDLREEAEGSDSVKLNNAQDTDSANVLTIEELQKMKHRMQQIQDNEANKTYRHDSHDIYEEGENTYAYDINLTTIFQNFIYNDSIKQQLLSIFENMDNSKQSNNFMICGDAQTGKTSLARAIAIAMWRLNRIPTKKVAKISASKLNQINLIEKMEQLADGSVVIEHASLLSSNMVKSIIQMIEHFDGRILVLLEDTTRDMEDFMMREEELRSFFTHRIILPRYNPQDITGFAYNMVKQQEYEVDENAREHFADKIEQLCRMTPNTEQLAKVKIYVSELIKKTETRNMFIIMKQAKEGKFSQKVSNVITIDDIIN